jgi:hypothetical protein
MQLWPGSSPSSYEAAGQTMCCVRVQEASALQELQRQHQEHQVRSVEVRLRILSRSAQVWVVPAFHFQYVYGEKQMGSVEILRQTHEALVPAISHQVLGAVVAERHVSPRKLQAAAAAATVGAKAVAVAVATGGAASAMDAAAAIGTVDTAFAAFIAASLAGVVARGLPSMLRERQAAALEAKADAVRGAYMPSGMGPGSIESPQDLWLREDLEWQRWSEAQREEWKPCSRKEWAERLLCQQYSRRCVFVHTAFPEV